MDPSKQTYRSSDMGLVAYFRLRGHSPTSIKYADGKCTWWFDDDGTMRSQAAEYRNGNALVDPKKYNESFKAVTSELREAASAA